VLKNLEFTRAVCCIVCAAAVSNCNADTFKISGAGIGAPANPFRWELESPDGTKRSLTEAGAEPAKIAAGDTIEFNTGNGNHGVIFKGLNLSQFEQMFEVLPGGVALSQDPGAGGGYGTAGIGPANSPILNVRVKDAAQGTSEFFCSVHGTGMKGFVEFGEGSETFKISGAGDGAPANPFRWELESPDGTKRSLTEAGAEPAKIAAGDTIEFNTGNGNHGVIFKGLNLSQFEQMFEVLPGGVALSQDPGAGGGYGTAGIGPANSPILNVRVKDAAQGTSEFFCSVHGTGMKGFVEFGEGSETFKISGAGDGAPANPFRWELESPDGTKRSLTEAGAEPAKIAAGDTIEFNTGNGNHGVIFKGLNQTQFEQMFEVLPGGVALSQDPGVGGGYGTAGIGPANSPILNVRVKDAAQGTSGFFCSVHGTGMKGFVEFKSADVASHVIDGVSEQGVNSWEIGGAETESLKVKAGETIEWRVEKGFHGLRFTSWEDDKKHFTVVGNGEIGFMHLLGRNPTASKRVNDVLLRIRINDVDAGTEIPFASLVHPSMTGKLMVVTDSN